MQQNQKTMLSEGKEDLCPLFEAEGSPPIGMARLVVARLIVVTVGMSVVMGMGIVIVVGVVIGNVLRGRLDGLDRWDGMEGS